MSLSEFKLIDRYCRTLGAQDNCVAIGVGDDAAVIDVPHGYSLVVSVDTLIEGQHFFADAKPQDVAHKLLHSNLSDMAAMGATPRWATLAVAIPRLQESWLDAFFSSLHTLSQNAGVAVVGGDTTKGPLALTLSIMGIVPQGAQLTRRSAQPNDLILVTGELGGAALGLKIELAKRGNQAEQSQQFKGQAADAALTRLNRPRARNDIGETLIGYARACIDISDGLLGDLQHVLDESGTDAEIDWNLIPIDPSVQNCSSLDKSEIRELSLNGGEDYELLYTCSHDQYELWSQAHPELSEHVKQIGRVLERTSTLDAGTIFLIDGKQRDPVSASSFAHF